MIYNEGQQNALKQIGYFLSRDNKDLWMCLSGSAGTGKTTIMKEAIKNYNRDIAVTAPTHKAKKVIGSATGFESCTIHKLCGLRPDMNLEEFNKNNFIFSQSGEEKIGDYGLILIDESSMLNTSLVQLLKEKSKMYGTKILYIGDKNQLPPVKDKEVETSKERVSLVFRDDDIKQVNLTKIERQKDGNPLLDLYIDILQDINSEKDLFRRGYEINDFGGYGFYQNQFHFGELVSEKFKIDSDDNKVIAYSNDKVRQWNNFIRKELIGDFNAPLCEQDKLMSYRTVLYQEGRIKEIISENSAEYKITSIRKSVRDGFSGYYTCLEEQTDLLHSEVFILEKTDSNYNNFILKEHEKSSLAQKETNKSQRGFLWKKYYEFRNKYLLLGDIKDKFGNIIVPKDFDYSYALTIHKSQGSTYNNVFVDEKDINNYTSGRDRNSLKYVAFTRPKNCCFINEG